MSYLILGFITGMSLILALGAQNIFVIEQGLKKEFVNLFRNFYISLFSIFFYTVSRIYTKFITFNFFATFYMG